jgi:hypothetical protein
VTPEAPALHPELVALEFLLGNWRGQGRGSYPGSEPFEFEEELVFSHAGKPVIVYSMRTWLNPAGPVSHAENGFWRCRDHTRVDCVAAHATGHVEISSGSVDGPAVLLSSSSISAWPGAKDVAALGRRLQLVDGVLEDSIEMQAVGQVRQGHTVARLRRA